MMLLRSERSIRIAGWVCWAALLAGGLIALFASSFRLEWELVLLRISTAIGLIAGWIGRLLPEELRSQLALYRKVPEARAPEAAPARNRTAARTVTSRAASRATQNGKE